MVEVADGQPFVLHPGEFVLASTLEVITLGDQLAGRLEGKSSLGRLGLLTHSTAGFIDPGFSGHVTLELSNVANLPIRLWPGMKIGQLCIFRLSSPAEHPYGSAVYGSRYQGQRGPTPSRSWQNWRTWPDRLRRHEADRHPGNRPHADSSRRRCRSGRRTGRCRCWRPCRRSAAARRWRWTAPGGTGTDAAVHAVDDDDAGAGRCGRRPGRARGRRPR